MPPNASSICPLTGLLIFTLTEPKTHTNKIDQKRCGFKVLLTLPSSRSCIISSKQKASHWITFCALSHTSYDWKKKWSRQLNFQIFLVFSRPSTKLLVVQISNVIERFSIVKKMATSSPFWLLWFTGQWYNAVLWWQSR